MAVKNRSTVQMSRKGSQRRWADYPWTHPPRVDAGGGGASSHSDTRAQSAHIASARASEARCWPQVQILLYDLFASSPLHHCLAPRYLFASCPSSSPLLFSDVPDGVVAVCVSFFHSFSFFCGRHVLQVQGQGQRRRPHLRGAVGELGAHCCCIQ